MKKLLLLLCIVFYSNTLFSAAAANQLDPKPFTCTKTNIAKTAILEALAATEELAAATASTQGNPKRVYSSSYQQKLNRKARLETQLTDPNPEVRAAAEQKLKDLEERDRRQAKNAHRNKELRRLTSQIAGKTRTINAIQEKLNADQTNEKLKRALTKHEQEQKKFEENRKILKSSAALPTEEDTAPPPDDLSSDELEDAPPPLDELSSEDDSEFEDAIPLLQPYQGSTQEELAARAPAAIPATPEQLAAAARDSQLIGLDDDLEPIPAATGLEAAQALVPAYAFPPGTTFFYLVTPEEAYPAAQAERPQAAQSEPNPNQKRFFCPYCDTSYNHKANLTKHIQAKHSQPK